MEKENANYYIVGLYSGYNKDPFLPFLKILRSLIGNTKKILHFRETLDPV